MYPKANVMIFGLWDGFSGYDNNSRKRGKMESMGAQFNRLIDFIRRSDVAQDVDITFVDLMVDDPGASRDLIDSLLDKGYKLPFVMINERMRYTGDINIRNIYNEVKMIAEDGCAFC